jgi:hypothetical protein
VPNEKNWFDQDEQQTTGAPSAVLSGNTDTATGNGSTTGAATTDGFTNLNKYLDSNKGGVDGLAGAVTGGLQTESNALKTGLDSYTANASKDIDANTYKAPVDFNKTLTNVANNSSNLNYNKNVDDAYSKEAAKDAYTGKTDATQYDGYSDLLGKYSNANDHVNQLAGDPMQRKNLLSQNQNLLGGGTAPQQYTSGQANLDSFLLNNDASAKGKLDSSIGSLKTSTDKSNVTNAASGVQNQIDVAKRTGQTNQEIRDSNIARQANATAGTGSLANQNRNVAPLAFQSLMDKYGFSTGWGV